MPGQVVAKLSPPTSTSGLFPEGRPGLLVQENDDFLDIEYVSGYRTTAGQLRSWSSFGATFGLFVATLPTIHSYFFPPFDLDVYSLIYVLWGLVALSYLSLLLSRPPLPIRLNRKTQEVFFYATGRLYREPWAQLQARVQMVFTISLTAGYELEFGFVREPGKYLWVSLGHQAWSRKNAYLDWEYLRLYMAQGLPVPIVTPQDNAAAIAADARLAVEERGASNWSGWSNPFIVITKLLGAPIIWLVIIPVMFAERQLEKYFTLRPARWPKEVETPATRPVS